MTKPKAAAESEQPLVARAIGAHNAAQERLQRERDQAEQRRQEECEEAKAKVLSMGEQVLDQTFGTHAGTTALCFLGSMSGHVEIDRFRAINAVTAIVYALEGLDNIFIAVKFNADETGAVYGAKPKVVEDQRTGDWITDPSRIGDLETLGRYIHDRIASRERSQGVVEDES